jgi:hypothetical protein
LQQGNHWEPDTSVKQREGWSLEEPCLLENNRES